MSPCRDPRVLTACSSDGRDRSEPNTLFLRGALQQPARFVAGSFTAASNVTGGLEDVDKVTATLHRGGALALWDYATAAPYVHVDMNPVASGTDDQVPVDVPAIWHAAIAKKTVAQEDRFSSLNIFSRRDVHRIV